MRELLLQRALGDLIFEAGAGASFQRDPAAFGGARDLDADDSAALFRFQDRLLIYRDLARASLGDPLSNIFPISQALLGDDWAACEEAFLDTRRVRSPHYRDIAPTFLAWLSESEWGRDKWPFLLSLAHYEFMEVMVTRWPAEGPGDQPVLPPSLEGRISLTEGAHLLTYPCAVHRATEEAPEPVGATTCLLIFRDPEGDFQVRELTPATSALLARAQEHAIGSTLADLGIQDEPAALALLEGLAEAGAILCTSGAGAPGSSRTDSALSPTSKAQDPT
ncbi:putative DNA-binding domain-containing protein [Geothrix sp. 21YS21S-2]|uniref:HvfC/BufC family peptide modification chaperone n=1 Tax=Geothrix sp. 21YS21S-2 TaxID=3068893 RepID=UPI0027BA6596|nr:putative DNA-binding domain-containing protein [Geothrix sp. 21YS21S-2]